MVWLWSCPDLLGDTFLVVLVRRAQPLLRDQADGHAVQAGLLACAGLHPTELLCMSTSEHPRHICF